MREFAINFIQERKKKEVSNQNKFSDYKRLLKPINLYNFTGIRKQGSRAFHAKP